jgi:4-hydroxybutyrate dehydrogenase
MISEMSFPTRIVFGKGALREVPNNLARLAVRRPLVVADARIAAAGLLARLKGVLDASKVAHTVFEYAEPGPRGSTVERGAAAYRDAGCDGIVAIGGGSSLDVGKGVRLLAAHPPPLAQYDDARDGWRLVTSPMPPMMAVPTAAGGGSEVSRSFAVALEETGRRAIVFAPQLMPSVAVCDPELTYDLPPQLTAAMGMDALARCVEALCAKGFHPLADALAVKGIALVAGHLVRAVRNGHDEEARAQMLVASLAGGAAAQKGLGAVHSIAHALGSIAGVHHGLAQAVVLPLAMEFNLMSAAPRLAEAAVAMGELPSDDTDRLARRAVERVRSIARDAGVPQRLRDVGVKESQLEKLTDEASEDAGHLSNPRPCARADLSALLHAAY